MDIGTRSDVAHLVTALSRIEQPSRSRRALSRALNKAVRTGRTQAAKLIREEWGVSSATIKSALSSHRSSVSLLVATLTARGARIPFKEFGARQTKKGVSVLVKRKEGRKRLRHAFIVKSLGSHVFERRGRTRLPIDKKFGPSIPFMFGRPEVLEQILKDAAGELPRIARAELEYEIKKALGKA